MGACCIPCFWLSLWPLISVRGHRGCCLAGDVPCKALSSVCGAQLAEPGYSETLRYAQDGLAGYSLDSRGDGCVPCPCLQTGCCILPSPGH